MKAHHVADLRKSGFHRKNSTECDLNADHAKVDSLPHEHHDETENGSLRKNSTECDLNELLVKADSLEVENELHEEMMISHHDDHDSRTKLLLPLEVKNDSSLILTVSFHEKNEHQKTTNGHSVMLQKKNGKRKNHELSEIFRLHQNDHEKVCNRKTLSRIREGFIYNLRVHYFEYRSLNFAFLQISDSNHFFPRLYDSLLLEDFDSISEIIFCIPGPSIKVNWINSI